MCFFLPSSQSGHQLAISSHIMGSKRPEKAEDRGTVQVLLRCVSNRGQLAKEEAYCRSDLGGNAQWIKITPVVRAVVLLPVVCQETDHVCCGCQNTISNATASAYMNEKLSLRNNTVQK